MSEEAPLIRKEKFYKFLLVILNCYLVTTAVVFSVYLFAPLIQGKLFVTSLIFYGSCFGMGILLKFMLRKGIKRELFKLNEFLMICLYCILCMLIWFPYPLNIFACVLISLALIFGYKAQIYYFKNNK